MLASISLVVLAVMWQVHWPAGRPHVRLVHGAAALSLVWGLAGWALTIVSAKSAGAGQPRAQLRDWVSVLRVATLALGLLAFIVLLYHAVYEAVFRSGWSLTFLLPGREIQSETWNYGFLDIALLAGALVAARVQTRDRRLNTAMFWLAIFAGLWVATQTELVRTVPLAGFKVQEVATRWSGVFMAWSAAVVGAFTLAAGYEQYRRRLSAWPNELWKLTTPAPEWPEFRYSVGVMSVLVLVLGLLNLTMPWTPFAGFVTGAALLALAAREWEENLADVGLALMTMGVVSLVALWRPVATSESDHFAEIINRAMIGLAIMAAFWHWLGDVWKQQLDQGQAWTTAGRLIRPTRRVGYLVAATGLLVSMNLAMWPLLHFAGPDHSAWRWVWGLAGNLLLTAAIGFATLRTGKPTLGWLALLAAGTTFGFVLARTRGSAAELWWTHYWPIALAGVAAGLLLLAAAIRRSEYWQAFWESVYLSAILVLPMMAIAGTAAVELLRLPRWVPSATFGCLAGVYLLAAIVPGPRGFMVAAAICAAVGVYMQVF
jgi:hypothetical protein